MEQAARAGEADASTAPATTDETAGKPKEIGGPDGPEPTRYGDWERGGICYDF
nr:succinate dehydrogenase assembly factor 4 [Ferruginivarius sediminum]